MSRTSADLVKGVLGSNYGKLPNGTFPDLQLYIDTAASVVDQAVTIALGGVGGRAGVSLSLAQQEIIERWLSAHFYCVMDPLFTTRSTGISSAGFQRGAAGEGFEATDYGKQACRLDPSGALMALSKRAFVGGIALRSQ